MWLQLQLKMKNGHRAQNKLPFQSRAPRPPHRTKKTAAQSDDGKEDKKIGGWYWVRTSDLFRVKEALFH